MRRMHVRGRVAAIVAASVVVSVVYAGAQVFTGVSLKVSKEFVPPGGIAQIKVFVTEPKPITTGGGRLSFDGLDEAGIALISPADDTFGVALVNASALDLSVVSRTSSFGTAIDYPVLTIALRTPPTSPLGVKFPVKIDRASLRLVDPNGIVYPTEIKNGFAQTAKGLSIDDVRPGSADLPAGAVVRILGKGFVPNTEVRFNEVRLSATKFVSDSRIDVVVGAPARMHGMRIRAINPDGTKVTYYSYQRTTRTDASLVSPFDIAVPLFPHVSWTSARIDLAGAHAGLAIQNLEPQSLSGRARLFKADGTLLVSSDFALPANTYVVKEISEVFRVAAPPGAFVRVSAAIPFQTMGVAVDSAGTATPVAPR